jgi:hypothetical protein
MHRITRVAAVTPPVRRRLVRSARAAVVTTFALLTLAVPARAQVELLSTERADSITVAGDRVLWKTDCGGEFDPALSKLRSIPAAGGETQTLYAPGSCRADRVSGENVAVDALHAYWLSGDGHVEQLARSASLGTPTAIATTAGPVSSFCCPMGVTPTHVVWAEGARVYRVPKGGGTRTPYGTPVGPGQIRDLRVLADGSVAYVIGQSLQRIVNDGFGKTQLLAGGVTAYAADASRIYFAQTPPTGDRQIRSLRLSDRGDPRLHATVARSTDVRAMEVDGANLYWHETRNLTGGPIVRLQLAGGLPVAITPYTLLNSLRGNGEFLFWPGDEGIHRLRVGAPPTAPPGDVWITGLEVTQGIQTTDNRVPLIAGKPTVVRVYVRSRTDAGGPWRVSAHLTGSGSARALAPANAAMITAGPDGSDRRTLTDSFAFLLEPGQTSQGRHTFRAQLFSEPAGRPQSDTSNDAMSVTVDFGPRIDRTLHVLTYARRQNGAVVSPRPTAEQIDLHRRVFANMHPLSSVTFVPVPGGASQEFSGDADTAFVDAHNWMKDQMAALFPDGGHDGLVLGPDDSTAGWCCSADAGNYVLRAQNQRNGPGETIAHEMGHRMIGNYHSYADPNWPYATAPADANGNRQASIGRNVGLKLYPALQTLPGLDATGAITTWDMMSDPAPLWPSPTSYCRVLDAYRGRPSCDEGVRTAQSASVRTTAAAGFGGRLGSPAGRRRFLQVSGVIDAHGHARLAPFERVSRAANPPRVRHGRAYAVALLDARGRTLRTRRFRLQNERHTKTPPPIVFGAYLRWHAATKRIVLRRGAKVIASRRVSAHGPRVRLLTTLAGKRLAGRQRLRWIARDADADRLTFAVDYSRDGGHRWIPIAHGLRRRAVTIDFGELPGSQRARLRVTASDGVRTAQDAGRRDFRVSDSGPSVRITPPVPDGSVPVFRRGQPLLLEGQAYDWEDGPLTTEAALRWRSDRDGALGNGPWTSAALTTPGRHIITLEARDSDGHSGRAQIAVDVSPRPWAP